MLGLGGKKRIAVFNILKEFCLLEGADKANFSRLMLSNLMSNIFQDIIDKLVGLDDVIIDSLYGNRAKIHQYKGLIDIIIDNYLHQKKTCYEVIIESKIAIYKEVKNIDKANPANSFYIDFNHNQEVHLLDHLYQIIFNVFMHAKLSTKLANNVNIKMKNLRTDKLSDIEFIGEQVTHMANSLHKLGGVSLMDTEDTLEILDVNPEPYKAMLDMVYSQICHVTRLSLNYVSGTTTGSLNTTGEGDRIQDEKAIRGYFNEYLKPILVEISSILGVNKNITIRSDNLARFQAVAPFLSVLEATELLSDDQKQELLKEALGVEFIGNEAK